MTKAPTFDEISRISILTGGRWYAEHEVGGVKYSNLATLCNKLVYDPKGKPDILDLGYMLSTNSNTGFNEILRGYLPIKVDINCMSPGGVVVLRHEFQLTDPEVISDLKLTHVGGPEPEQFMIRFKVKSANLFQFAE